MTSERANPLYSPLGCGSALLLTLILGVSVSFAGPVLFSPGKLSTSSAREDASDGFTSHAAFETECHLCHESWNGVEPELCVACHEDVAVERQARLGMHGRLPGTDRCLECHTDHNGRDSQLTTFSLVDFPHDSLTNFSLALHLTDYSDELLQCSECHSTPLYTVDTANCIDCHQEHDSEFASRHRSLFGDACLECHDGLDSMAKFNHESIFPLDGGHQGLACEVCHSRLNNTTALRECIACHEEPSIHRGRFGTDCGRCHNAAAWTPAQLSQHIFPLDHGDQGKVECRICHQASYVEFTCFGCHEHEPQELLEEHLEEEIEFHSDCVACHPTGLVEET